uniref:Uncharacterized protein n=1 Tax=Anguilla anguilla TaxID=7936 RepID=A0A0E9XN06_ANGAN
MASRGQCSQLYTLAQWKMSIFYHLLGKYLRKEADSNKCTHTAPQRYCGSGPVRPVFFI